MTPVNPPTSNAVFTPPEDMEESQVSTIRAYRGVIPPGSNLDGAAFVVVAWKPDLDDLKRLNEGGCVYLSSLGGLNPHFLSTLFAQATYGLED